MSRYIRATGAQSKPVGVRQLRLRQNCRHNIANPLMRKSTSLAGGPFVRCTPWQRSAFVVLAAFILPALRAAQPPSSTPQKLISKDDAIRIALAYNQSLRAQRINVDQNKAEEITALLKPNPVFSTIVDTVPLFSPSTIRFSTQVYSQDLSYTVERGGKRVKRGVVAKDNTEVTTQTVSDNERTLRFQVVQSFIGVLLAKSVLDLAQGDLSNFSQVVELNRARVVAGDLAEGDYLKLSIQKLQFEQDVSAAKLALIQARTTLRQQLGYQSVADDFDVAGTLTHAKPSVSLDDLQRRALGIRPDLQAAHTGVKLANDTVALAFGNRARDWTFGGDYTNQNGGINGVGVSFSIELPTHDRNQGEIARSQAAVRQSVETESSAQVVVLTDVVNAYHGLQSNEEIVSLYESGYLDQAAQSRDISTYAYQHGAATILDVLDAERSYRATQLAYRQALAAHMTAAEQVNEAVGAQVIQ
jgi:cobalt-zinc-cadmium efflux system outer membrane protein